MSQMSQIYVVYASISDSCSVLSFKNEQSRMRTVKTWDKIRNKLSRITENNILIQEHPCVLIDSGDMYANSIRKITSVLISVLT